MGKVFPSLVELLGPGSITVELGDADAVPVMVIGVVASPVGDEVLDCASLVVVSFEAKSVVVGPSVVAVLSEVAVLVGASLFVVVAGVSVWSA